MSSSRCSILLCAFILFTLQAAAQVQQVKIMPFSGTNGISLGKINSMTRDKFGFIWFSDQSNRCIVRYDGTRMTRFQNDPGNPNSLGGFYPECLFADSAGNIWIGFYGMGLDKFDPLTNTFTHYRHKKEDPGSLADDFVAAVLVDHLGKIWVGTYKGLDMLDEKTGTFKHFSNKPGVSTTLSSDTIRALYEDHSGELWIGTGFAFSPGNDGGLNRFHRTSGTFTRYLHDSADPNSIANNKVRSIYEDSHGNFWVGTAGDGLHTLDRSTGRFTHYYYDASKPDQLSRPAVNDFTDHITFIIEDADRKIWIGALLNGLTRYDPASRKLQRYGSGNELSGPYKDSTSWTAVSTSEGLIWYSTQRAELFKIDIFNTAIPFVSVGNSSGVYGFTETDSAHLWIDVPDGLIKIEQLTGKTVDKIIEPGNKGLSTVGKDRMSNIWIGTQDGLYRYNPRSGSFRLFPLEKSSVNSANYVFSLAEDSQSGIWACTNGNGLFLLDPESGKLVHYKNSPANPNTLSNDFVTDILEDKSGDIWIGTGANGGLNRLNRKTGTFSRYLPGLNITCLFGDKKGMLWAASESGLFYYDSSVNGFESYTGEIAGTSIVQISAITEDNEGNLWISTESGIYRLNSKRNHITRYGKESGVFEANNFFIYGSAYKSSAGLIYFGNETGYYFFDPHTLENIPASTHLYFTHFWLNNKEIRSDPDILKGSFFTANNIHLKHDQNLFSVSAAIVDLRNSGSNILYQLENFELDWRPASADERVSYYNVPPGNYTLRIKTADNKSGEWVEKSIKIIISPPWWNTWWAYVFYGLVAISLLFIADRIQRKRIIEKERRHSREKELAQAKEIEQAYHQLKATQSQLIQSEKMASLGELTAGIAHEIQNPLNFVNNFAEVNRELVAEMKEEIARGNFDEVKVIATGIENNSAKISEHGKRADSIVKSMLQHSRVNSGQKESTDINNMADEYLRLSYHGLRAKDKSFNAALETDFESSLPRVNVIPQDIGRVLLNLYNNAFYVVMEKKKQVPDEYIPTVSVSTKRTDHNIEIRVKDNGPGIPEKIREKIFQPFFTTKPSGQGTGLGLSLSYDIVKAHNGELSVESQEGEGATFTLSLPYK